MKEISILHDAVNNETFGVVVKQDDIIRFYGAHASSRDWATWANSVSSKSVFFPTGVISGSFRIVNDAEYKSLVSEYGYVADINDSIAGSKSYRFKSFTRQENTSKVPAINDTPIDFFPKSQYVAAVSYKGLSMRASIKMGSFLHEARQNGYVFNEEKSQFNASPNKYDIKSLRQRIDKNVTSSSERRIGMKFVDRLNLDETITRAKVGKPLDIKTKSLNIEVKSSMGAAGSGARKMRRITNAMEPFDARALDGDGDGLVQEGTPFERPVVPGTGTPLPGTESAVARMARTAAQPVMRPQTIGSSRGKITEAKPPVAVRSVAKRTERMATPSRTKLEGLSSLAIRNREKTFTAFGLKITPDHVSKDGAKSVEQYMEEAKNWGKQINPDSYQGDTAAKKELAKIVKMGFVLKQQDNQFRVYPPDNYLKHWVKWGLPNWDPASSADRQGATPSFFSLHGKQTAHGLTNDFSSVFGFNPKNYTDNQITQWRDRVASNDIDVLDNAIRHKKIRVPNSDGTFRSMTYGEFRAEAKWGPKTSAAKLGPARLKEPKSGPGMNSRIQSAQIERAKEGLDSRAGKFKKLSKAKPGVDKVAETDGKAWDSLSDAEKATVRENLIQRRKDLMDQIKKAPLLRDWWDGFVHVNGDKRDPNGTPWNKDSELIGFAQGDLEVEIGDIIDHFNSEEFRKANPSWDDVRVAKEKKKLLQQLDDLRTLNAMNSRDDYSLIEHLHSPSKKAGWGQAQRGERAGGYKKVSVNAKNVNLSSPSSLFGEGGGLDVNGKPILDAKKDTKLKKLSRRLAEESPRKVRRRQRKNEKAQGQEFTFTPGEVVGKTRRKIRKASRQLAEKFRGTRSAEQIAKQTEKGQGGTLVTMKGEKLVIGKQFVEALAHIHGLVREGKTKSGFKNQKNANTVLANLWEENKFNKPAVVLTEKEFRQLVEAGWTPMVRGHGSPPAGESHADTYIHDQLRFITGEGGELMGVGEYWARASDGGSWFSWTSSDKENGTVGLIPPSAKRVTRETLGQHNRDNQKVIQAMEGYMAGFPTDEAERLDPKDFVAGLRKHMAETMSESDPTWNTHMGQIWSQLINNYEGSSPKDAAAMWDAMSFVRSMPRFDVNYYAPVLGYDTVQGPTGDGRELVHNRAAIAVLSRPVSMTEAKELWKRG